jgi:hypothetical protein
MHKDIRLALAAAREHHVPLPAAEVAEKVLTHATDLGYVHRDIAAIFEMLRGHERGIVVAVRDDRPRADYRLLSRRMPAIETALSAASTIAHTRTARKSPSYCAATPTPMTGMVSPTYAKTK